MRGVVVYLLIIMTVMLAFFVGVSILEPLGEEVKTYDSIDDGALDGTGVINDVYTSVFKWMPLIVLGGMGLWALRWYIRKESLIGRQGGRR